MDKINEIAVTQKCMICEFGGCVSEMVWMLRESRNNKRAWALLVTQSRGNEGGIVDEAPGVPPKCIKHIKRIQIYNNRKGGVCTEDCTISQSTFMD